MQECRLSLRQHLCPLPRVSHSGTVRRLRRHCSIAASADTTASSGAWWDKINRLEGIRGPNWQPPEKRVGIQPMEEQKKAALGDHGYRSWETIKMNERQRVWDAMRLNARVRYSKGEMPDWFDPEWLNIEEAPMNTYWREQGLEPYQTGERDLELIGDGGTGGNAGTRGGSGSGGGWWWWWNEEDPYWMLRDWGDHPMRWWTLGFASILAVGGFMAYLQTGSSEALQFGWAAGALLTGCSMAMSDMTFDILGDLAVKLAWVVCASLAAKELFVGWRHKRTATPRSWQLESCGWAAVAMCVLYMWTGMSELQDHALPMNPGGAFKNPDVAMKHRVWERWGYGDIQMR